MARFKTKEKKESGSYTLRDVGEIIHLVVAPPGLPARRLSCWLARQAGEQPRVPFLSVAVTGNVAGRPPRGPHLNP